MNELSSRPVKLDSFIVVGTWWFVDIDFGCGKISSSEFGVQRQSRLVRELFCLIGEVQEFVFRQLFVSQRNARHGSTLCNSFRAGFSTIEISPITQARVFRSPYSGTVLSKPHTPPRRHTAAGCGARVTQQE